jgi:hypothetical protein
MYRRMFTSNFIARVLFASYSPPLLSPRSPLALALALVASLSRAAARGGGAARDPVRRVSRLQKTARFGGWLALGLAASRPPSLSSSPSAASAAREVTRGRVRLARGRAGTTRAP